jgi:hypothetical protein
MFSIKKNPEKKSGGSKRRIEQDKGSQGARIYKY